MSIKRKNLAIICQNRKVPFVFEEAQAADIDVTFFYNACEGEPDPLPAVIKNIALPLFEDEELSLDIIIQEHNQNPFDGILTLFEPALNFTAKAASKLQLHFLPLNVIEQCRNKYRTRHILRNNGLNTPNFWEVSDGKIPDKDTIRFPVVVKPINGFSSQGIIRVNSIDDIDSAVNKVSDINNNELGKFINGKGGVLIEEFIDGPEFAIETFSFLGQVLVLSIGDKGDCKGPYFEEGIYVAPANIDSTLYTAISDEVKKVVLALGITDGPAHVELRIDPQKKPYVIEVAPRIGGSGISHHIVKSSTNINFMRMVILNAMSLITPSDLPKSITPRYTAGNYIIPIQGSGIFECISGISELSQHPDVLRIFEFIEPGTNILPYPHFTGYPGFILTRHTDYNSCKIFHRHLSEKLAIIYK